MLRFRDAQTGDDQWRSLLFDGLWSSLLVAVGIWREEVTSAKKQAGHGMGTGRLSIAGWVHAPPPDHSQHRLGAEGWRQFGWPELAHSCRRPDSPATPWGGQTHQEQALKPIVEAATHHLAEVSKTPRQLDPVMPLPDSTPGNP